MKKAALWSSEEVSHWLMEEGMDEYSQHFQGLSRQAILELTEADFQKPPLSLVPPDNVRQLLKKINTLSIECHMEAHKNGHANGTVVGRPMWTDPDCLISMPDSKSLPLPLEWDKTAVAFFYALCCFFLTTVMISVVHERVPPKDVDPPLPDKFFDIFDRREWAFSICEVNGMLLVLLWALQWAFLKHKSIIARRFFFIVGTLYLYRCITMYVTTLPVPGMHFKCSSKLSGDWESQMRRVLKMFAGGGLSITGAHHMCGDYLYSGHTVMLTLTYLFIKEYSSEKFLWYHRFCWTLSAVGIFCILLAHDHYTVDVVVAYYVTTRLFWWYHTMANQLELKENPQGSHISRVWWYRLFQYFERNVRRTVPVCFQLPLPWQTLPWPRWKGNRMDML